MNKKKENQKREFPKSIRDKIEIFDKAMNGDAEALIYLGKLYLGQKDK